MGWGGQVPAQIIITAHDIQCLWVPINFPLRSDSYRPKRQPAPPDYHCHGQCQSELRSCEKVEVAVMMMMVMVMMQSLMSSDVG